MIPSETMPVVQALGWTLIHFLWQGAAVALLLAIINAALKDCAANLRYLSSCIALLLMLGLPLITFAALRSDRVAAAALTTGAAARIGAGSLPAGETTPATAHAFVTGKRARCSRASRRGSPRYGSQEWWRSRLECSADGSLPGV